MLSFCLQETYPSTPPVWFSESEDVSVTSALTSLSETSGLENHLLNQVKRLVRILCSAFALPEPQELKVLEEGGDASHAFFASASLNGAKSHHKGEDKRVFTVALLSLELNTVSFFRDR